MARLEAELPELKIVDATKVVSTVAAVKSEVEIETMRRAWVHPSGHRDDELIAAGGITEAEVAEAMKSAVLNAGAAWMREFTLLFGPRTSLPHGLPTSYALQQNQPVFTETGGWANGYAGSICRSAVLGSHAGAESLHALAEEALEAAIGAIRPGARTGDVDAACRGVIEKSGRPEVFKHRTGYQNGIMWSDRGNLSLEPDSGDVLAPGMTFHMPIILFESGQYGVGVSETVWDGPGLRGAERLPRGFTGWGRGFCYSAGRGGPSPLFRLETFTTLRASGMPHTRDGFPIRVGNDGYGLEEGENHPHPSPLLSRDLCLTSAGGAGAARAEALEV